MHLPRNDQASCILLLVLSRPSMTSSPEIRTKPCFRMEYRGMGEQAGRLEDMCWKPKKEDKIIQADFPQNSGRDIKCTCRRMFNDTGTS